MSQLTFQQFLLRQPSYPAEQPTDKFYYELCLHLISLTDQSGLMADYHPTVVQRTILALVGYLQDVIADAGLWHAFIDRCRALYNRTLPFYDTGEEYIDYELNRADIRFMIWYASSMYSDRQRCAYPLDTKLMQLADMLYEELEKRYDDCPMPEGYVFGRELELHDPDDREDLMQLGHWLFMHSWLLSPAFALTLTAILSEPEVQKGDMDYIQSRLEQSMAEDPTGPLALYLPEWVSMVAEGKMPRVPRQKNDAPPAEHPYYTAVMKYTGGREIAYFATYADLNNFFIEVLGWDKGEQHLASMADEKDFVILVNREKGMLLAKGVAKCIADPDNHLYDKTYAAQHAIDMLTVRGVCPHDLFEYVTSHGWLVDAAFPSTDDTALVTANADFIARCYLQQYYRGD